MTLNQGGNLAIRYRTAGEEGSSAIRSVERHLPDQPAVTLGGLPIAVVDRAAAADMMIQAARRRPRGDRPLFLTSANGEVIARTARDSALAEILAEADQILADGQSLVFASRFVCRHALPERVATTDLFHDVARRAVETGTTFYLFGATEEENARAAAAAEAAHPGLAIVGRTHGYLSGAELIAKLDEIDALAPDILWLGLGVPREQEFVRAYGHRLRHVGVIKTSGGLFNHLSGKNPRAPGWMQKAGFEWLWRALIEPRRLLWRYLSTNPQAIYSLLRHSS